MYVAHPSEICELDFSAEHQVSLPGKSDVGVVDNCWYVDVQIRVLYSCGANVFPPHVANHSGHCAVERTVEQSRAEYSSRTEQQQRSSSREQSGDVGDIEGVLMCAPPCVAALVTKSEPLNMQRNAPAASHMLQTRPPPI